MVCRGLCQHCLPEHPPHHTVIQARAPTLPNPFFRNSLASHILHLLFSEQAFTCKATPKSGMNTLTKQALAVDSS